MSTGKGKKRLRGIPVLHNEKKTKHTLLITPKSWDKLQHVAQNNGLSISEYVEQWIISLSDGEFIRRVGFPPRNKLTGLPASQIILGVFLPINRTARRFNCFAACMLTVARMERLEWMTK